MDKLTEFLTKPFLNEGARDPGIFKAIFLAGGPGSGKSFVAQKLFGIPEKVNVSKTGLKMVNQDSELELLLKKYFGTTDIDNMPDELFADLTGVDKKGKAVDYDTSGLRKFAKSLSKERLRLYTNGKLGVIIDGTGHNFSKIKKRRKDLMDMGYDTYMVFVNTSLKIARERNEKRDRVVPDAIVQKSWEDVQGNLGAFQGLFGGSNFMIVQNNKMLSDSQITKHFKMLVSKGIDTFLKKPIKSKVGKAWLRREKKHQKVFKDPGQSKFFESIEVPVELGDTVLMGRFKNKRVVVKSIDYNEKGDLLINGRTALKFRVMKKDTNEEFGAPAGILPSPSRKMVKKMKKKGNTSVPYGSGYNKVSEAQAVKGSKVAKFITGHNLTMKGKKYKEIEFETLSVDNSSKMIKLKIIAPKNLFGMETPVRFSTIRRGPFTKTDTGKKLKEVQKTVTDKVFDKKRESGAWTVIGHMKKKGKSTFHVRDEKSGKRFDVKLMEQKQIKKTIGVFGGRFQPFHSGHLATYNWLKTKVDEVYITTSNIKQPPRHPMDFKEKVRHMTKMGIPKNRIVMEKSPYVAKNLLSKFNKDTTAVVYAFGKKDAGRLKAGKGKYFQDYKKSQGNINGYEENGYFITAPQFGNVSGTQMRKLLGDPKLDDSDRVKSFKKVFGYYDKGVYTMMTNKFKKLFESYTLSDDLIKEFLTESTTALSPTDDGPPTFYKGFNDYKKYSKKWMDDMYSGAGWKVLQYILGKHAINPDFDYTLNYNVVPAVAYGNKQSGEYGTRFGTNNPIKSYKDYIEGTVLRNLGYELIKWMGITPDGKNYTGVEVETPVLPGIGDDNVGNTEKKKLKVKESFNLDDEVKLLIEGGAYGHLNHPFDDKNLTFSDFKTLIINTLQGKLDSEGAVTEKTDGQNIMISWKNDKLIAARNKGHIKNHGANALSVSGIKNMFAGRGEIETAFVSAMRDLEKALKGLSKKQKDKIFGEGKKFMSLEVIYPKTANVIPYDKSLLQFHGTIEYDTDGSPIGEDRGSARVLAGMIKQINQNIQKTYSITKPFITNLPKVKNFAKRQSYFLGKLNKLQSQYQLGDRDTLADYHQAYWMEYIYNGAKQTDYKNPANDVLMKLTKRWAFFDKSYKIPQIRKDLQKYPKFLNWVLNTDKIDHAKLQKQHIRDWEVLFFELGAEILSNLSDFIAANPSKSAQTIRKDLKSAINKVKTSKDPKVINTLKVQLDRLKAIGGLKAVVPSEGITFVYKGKLFKYTGAFAPANQILGMLKFV